MAVRAVDLDFLATSRSGTRLGPLLLLAGVLAVSGVLWRDRTLTEEAAQLHQRVGDSRRFARPAAPVAQDLVRDPKQLALEVTRANGVLANLAVPWDALFAELEAASNSNVALLSIQPGTGGKRVLLSGEARRFEDLLSYMQRLESTSGFANVLLTEHEMRNASADRAVSFTLAADWVGRQ
jgi:Fimbrial assembly protein (PilN)